MHFNSIAFVPLLLTGAVSALPRQIPISNANQNDQVTVQDLTIVVTNFLDSVSVCIPDHLKVLHWRANK